MLIHEADRASDLSGAVEYGAAIDFAGAVARRRANFDVVIVGDGPNANRAAAGAIEAAVGPTAIRQFPHRKAGPHALPHWQQRVQPPEGHTFYETENRKARRKQ